MPGDLARPAAHVEALAAGRIGGEAAEQPTVERLGLQLVAERGGVRLSQPVVLGSHGAVPSARPTGQHLLPVDLWSRLRRRGLRLAEQMGPAAVVLTGLTVELADQRWVGHRQLPQGDLDRLAIGERVQPLGSGSQLARSLRATQQQDSDQRRLWASRLSCSSRR